MDKLGNKYGSFAEAEAAEKDYYHSLTPEERMNIMLELIRQGAPDEAFQRLERVCRIVKLHES